MKRLCLLFALFVFLPASLSAQIYADFKTSKGNFTYILDYENAPLAVANFIGLAEGSRPWIEETTGNLKVNKPFYNGLTFHRVVNSPSENPNFKIAQGGSPNGLGSDGPGFSFPDDANRNFNSQYLLAMANSGPNSNGSQFFLTGSSTITSLNGQHSVFGGLVAQLPQQSLAQAAAIVMDIIDEPTDANSKPLTPVIINSIAIRRVGAASSFNINSQGLPTITRPKPVIQHTPATSTLLNFTPPASSLTKFYFSQNLVSWQGPLNYYVDATVTPISSFNVGTFTGNPSSCFFNLSTVDYLNATALMPSTLNGRTLTVSNELGNYYYQFTSEPVIGGNPLQICGTVTRTPTGGGTATNGAFAVAALQRDGHGMTIELVTNLPTYSQFRHRFGWDSLNALLILGRANHAVWIDSGPTAGYVPIADMPSPVESLTR